MTTSRRLRISIVTPSLNQGAFIERTIRSVLEQAGDFDLEYLVVDGGSNDGTLDLLRRWEGRLRWSSEKDSGQASAVNKGLRAVTGDVVGWVNSDDRLLPGALDKVARAFRADPGLVWLHGRCEIVDEEDRSIRQLVTRYKDWRCRRHSLRRLLVENYISQMTVFWRRSALERVGYLDESLHYTFDYDLWLRLARVASPLYIPEPIAAFRWYGASKSGSSFERQFEEDYRVFERHAPAGALIRAHKWLRTRQIVGAYRIMRSLRIGTGA